MLDLSSGEFKCLDPVLGTALLLVSMVVDLEALLHAQAIEAVASLQAAQAFPSDLWQVKSAYREAEDGNHSSAELLEASSFIVRRAA